MTISNADGDLLALQCQQYILERIPQGLIERFEVQWIEQDFKVVVRLKREPTGEELEQLNGTITKALEEFREKAG